MSEIDIEENMKIVRWVWIGLNVALIIYAIALIVYAKWFRKAEILHKNNIEERASISDNISRHKRSTYKGSHNGNKVFDRSNTDSNNINENLLNKLEKEV